MRTAQTAFLAGVITLGAWTAAIADTETYICTLTDYMAYGADGKEWVPKDAMKTPMTIDRRTGAVIHPWLGTTSYREVRVLNPGSADWSFKVLADSGGGGNVVYIEVSEFVEGPRKPLVVVAGQVAYSGYCE